MYKPFTYVSLFSGVGGFETALNSVGGKCVMASDFDKFANQSYKALYGEETSGDVTKIDAADVPVHDLLVGGFPCQSFSVAGNRGGFEDSRGTMFFEVARIAKRRKPKAILLENVKGLVSHDKGKTLDTIFKTLNDIGYTVDFDILNSKFYDVPQNRERIFIVALRDDLVDSEPWEIAGNTIIPKGKKRISGYDDVKTFNFDYPTNSDVTTRLRDILESEVDEKYYLSEDKTATLIAQLEEKQMGDSENCEMLGMLDMKGNESIRRVYSPNGIGSTLTTMGGGHREPKIAEEFSEGDGISYCLDANYSKGTSVGDIGKGRRTHIKEVRPVLIPDRIEKQQNGRRLKDNDEESFTLTAQDRHGVLLSDVKDIVKRSRGDIEIGITTKDNGDIRPHRMDKAKSGISELAINHEDNPSNTVTSSHAPKIYGVSTRYRIRKLTPLECWRLQGFTDEQFNKVRAAGLSDSQLYKQAGNAVTVNVVKAIAERLIKYL